MSTSPFEMTSPWNGPESSVVDYRVLYGSLKPGESYDLGGIADYFCIKNGDPNTLEKVMSMGIWNKKIKPGIGLFYEYGGMQKLD